jgi:tRNA(Ile)-lysidine synthase
VTPPAARDVLARCRFPPAGTAVTCAVSGGPDSLALLVLAVEADLAATAVHVDHGLREGSAAEADVVASAAERLGAGFRAERVEVAPGGDLEARARAARRSVLPADALYGHTADDQAETVLLALIRGAGLDGLRGIRPEGHPLLALRRSDTEAVCAAAGLEPVRDPTNAEARFRRNRIRAEVLPLLDEIAERDVAGLIARAAGVLLDDAEHLEHLSAVIDPTDAVGLAAAPVALGRRAVRRWLRDLDPERHPPDAAGVERVLAVARGEVTAAQVSGGIEVRRSHQRLTARVLPPRPH